MTYSKMKSGGYGMNCKKGAVRVEKGVANASSPSASSVKGNRGGGKKMM